MGWVSSADFVSPEGGVWLLSPECRDFMISHVLFSVLRLAAKLGKACSISCYTVVFELAESARVPPVKGDQELDTKWPCQ